jgi:phosphoheptose isomerase
MSYFDDYTNMIGEALATVDRDKVEEMTAKLVDLAKIGLPVLVCGNGGSAAIAEHMSCDHTKGVGMDTDLKPFFIPLQSNVSMLTAIANDIGYNEVFRQQIKMFPNKNAGVLAISSSGSSGNIFNALDVAKFYKMPTMAMVGFDGGSVVGCKVADIVIHVKSNNYGVVEDCHQIIMHSWAQALRVSAATEHLKQ